MSAGAYLLAAGAEPCVPDLSGLDQVDYLTSTTAMDQRELPDSLIVIGAGYVGMEQAQLFSGLGVKVTVVGRLAPRTEPELREVMAAAFSETASGCSSTGWPPSRQLTPPPTPPPAARASSWSPPSGLQVAASRLLLAAGRAPRTSRLNLPAAGVKTDERGFVVVNDHQRTVNPHIFAAGDMTGGPQYVYVAAAHGRVAAANALGASDRVDYAGLPAVMFARPQLASAALTEDQALEAGDECDCRTWPWPTCPGR